MALGSLHIEKDLNLSRIALDQGQEALELTAI
jgi:hypothetical protein